MRGLTSILKMLWEFRVLTGSPVSSPTSHFEPRPHSGIGQFNGPCSQSSRNPPDAARRPRTKANQRVVCFPRINSARARGIVGLLDIAWLLVGPRCHPQTSGLSMWCFYVRTASFWLGSRFQVLRVLLLSAIQLSVSQSLWLAVSPGV